MIENHRRFESCVMCGADEPLTAEHLFGKSFARRIGERNPWRALNVAEDGTTQVATGGHPLLFTTYKCLCSECNTSRFSQMMSDATPLLISLAQGEQVALTDAHQEVLLRYFERLGFLIDVVTSDYQQTADGREQPEAQRSAEFRAAPPAYSQGERRDWLFNGPRPNAPKVFLGNHQGVLGLELECSVDQAVLVLPHGLVPVRAFHLAVGNLVVDLQWPIVSEHRAPSSSYFALSPPFRPTNWPPASAVTYEEFFATHCSSARVYAEQAFWANPDRRAEREAHARTNSPQRVATGGSDAV